MKELSDIFKKVSSLDPPISKSTMEITVNSFKEALETFEQTIVSAIKDGNDNEGMYYTLGMQTALTGFLNAIIVMNKLDIPKIKYFDPFALFGIKDKRLEHDFSAINFN